MIDVGQTVGNYKITAKLGEGGMGMVFLAEHPVIGSKVALKAIHPHFARNADVVSRFVTEARAVNQIAHQHIVDITDFGHTPAGDFYFIMEYLQGEMLSDGILRRGALPPARALNIAAQVADALQASHEHGVIHRDLKPDNVFLISRDAELDFVKVLDFGLAKLAPIGATPTHNTGPGTVMGTPYYMSPEQCEGKTAVDHRSDVYALGVILFEMLTGCVPFGGSGFGEVIIKHVTVRPPAARSLVPGLSPAIDAILTRALSKDPGERFQSMADFRAALLDPDSYGAALPVSVTDDDLSGRVRAALPTARTEMVLRLASRPPPVKLRLVTPPPSPLREDTTDDAGEIVDDAELKPKRNHGGLFLVGLAALAGVGVASVTVRQRAGDVIVTAVARTKASAGRVDYGAVRGKARQLFTDAVALAKPSRASAASEAEEAGDAPSDPKRSEQTPVAAPPSPEDDPPVTDPPPTASMTVKARGERPRHRARRDVIGDDADATLPPSVD